MQRYVWQLHNRLVILLSFTDTIIEGDLDEKFIHNKSDVNIKLKTQKCVYNIPGLSSFFMSDICEFDLLMPHLGWYNCLQCRLMIIILSNPIALVCRKYNLIVIDPPWENRSAIRGKK